MTTVAIRKKLVDYLSIADDKKLKAVYTLLEDDMKDSERISITDYNKEIDISLDDIKKGKVRSHEDVSRISNKW
ncbi:MAG: hypothetical protein EOP53_17645 [Sphingobacteriales bacterium]|nr:MAG: hypothetical protein EOP53_17645 [Sphingobacteriales bacterium]